MSNIQESWSRDWTKYLVVNEKFDTFPLQFVNIDRIEKEENNAVFIFDEVGAGKTISAGLMALHYLYNHQDKNALVVALPSSVRPSQGKPNGQFLGDLFDLLPYETLGLVKNVKIINNWFSNIEKQEEKPLGLLIVDEAHEFLHHPNDEKDKKKRKEALCNLRAEKVVFMTATPMKYGRSDLEQYCEMAECITGKSVDRSWMELLLGTDGEAICETFHPTAPVTRYFKDTITALEYVEENGQIDFDKNKARRQIPELWKYTGRSTEEKIASLINILVERQAICNGAVKNRYVIFTRYISREAEKIRNAMAQDQEHFEPWNGKESEGKLSYVCIHGESEHSVQEFSHNGTKKPLPDIIIITYKMAEAGVNLPGYSHVINYHIPAYPSALEQRFGRIDRMGTNEEKRTLHDEIHMAYLLSDGGMETYKLNFYTAVHIYLQKLLTNIPAKNTLLTTEILQAYHHDLGMLREKYNSLLEMCENREIFSFVAAYFRELVSAEQDELLNEWLDRTCEEQLITDGVKKKAKELLEFCAELEIAPELEESELREAIVQEIKSLKSKLQDGKRSEKIQAQSEQLLTEIGDKIYYFAENDWEYQNLITLDAIKDAQNNGCTQKISRQAEYLEYVKRFNEDVKMAKVFAKYSERVEAYFEEQFLAERVFPGETAGRRVGCFKDIFTLDYSDLMRNKILLREEFSEEKQQSIKPQEKLLLIEHATELVVGLPFFRMCRSYKEELEQHINWTKEGYLREGLRDHALKVAYTEVKRQGLIPERIALFAPEFETYPSRVQEDNGNYECSNWLKLAVQSLCDPDKELLQFVKLFRDAVRKCLERWDAAQGEYTGLTDMWQKDKEVNRIICRLQDYPETMCARREDFFRMLLTENRNWRSPYKMPGSKYVAILPYTIDGRGTNQIWYTNSEFYTGCDLWTYLLFRTIGGGIKKKECVLSREWWDLFMSERCIVNGKREERVSNFLKNKVLEKRLNELCDGCVGERKSGECWLR